MMWGSTGYIIQAYEIWRYTIVISKLLKCPQGSRRIIISIILILMLSTVNINELTNRLYPSLSPFHSGNVPMLLASDGPGVARCYIPNHIGLFYEEAGIWDFGAGGDWV